MGTGNGLPRDLGDDIEQEARGMGKGLPRDLGDDTVRARSEGDGGRG